VKVSKVVLNFLTTSLKVRAFDPKGALINRSHGESVCHFTVKDTLCGRQRHP
jgi:hypothetical protein